MGYFISFASSLNLLHNNGKYQLSSHSNGTANYSPHPLLYRWCTATDGPEIISYLVFLRPGTVWYWVLGSIPGEAKPNPVLNPKPSTTQYRVSKRLGNEFTPPMTIPGLKVCNEFITSKTFLLEFANYKTFINNKTFVGPLTRMAGKRDVMTCAFSCVTSQQYHGNVILVAATRM